MTNKIKWWIKRANNKLPECDTWDYKYTLVNNLIQGLEAIINSDKLNHNLEQSNELQYILDWAKDFAKYDTAIIVQDEIEKESEWASRIKQEVKICSQKEWEEWQKRTQKAMQYLGKNIHGLWY